MEINKLNGKATLLPLQAWKLLVYKSGYHTQRSVATLAEVDRIVSITTSLYVYS